MIRVAESLHAFIGVTTAIEKTRGDYDVHAILRVTMI